MLLVLPRLRMPKPFLVRAVALNGAFRFMMLVELAAPVTVTIASPGVVTGTVTVAVFPVVVKLAAKAPLEIVSGPLPDRVSPVVPNSTEFTVVGDDTVALAPIFMLSVVAGVVAKLPVLYSFAASGRNPKLPVAAP